jgi:hypothetical protein
MKATARRTAEEATRSLADSRVPEQRRRLGGRSLRRLTGGNRAANGRRTKLALDAAKDVRPNTKKRAGGR